jgi:hypothetical protein
MRLRDSFMAQTMRETDAVGQMENTWWGQVADAIASNLRHEILKGCQVQYVRFIVTRSMPDLSACFFAGQGNIPALRMCGILLLSEFLNGETAPAMKTIT